MLAELFYWLLNMSIVGAVSVVVIIGIRAISRVPCRVIVWLWAIPLCRFCVPIGIGGRFGLMALVGRFFSKTVMILSGEFATVSSMNVVQEAQTYFPMTYKSLLAATVFRTASVIWLIVTVLLLVGLIWQYSFYANILRGAKHLQDNVWQSDRVDVPMVYGVFRPRILIPVTDSPINRLMLRHEQIHIRRMDNLARLLALIIASVHWFNPFAWIFLRLYLHDQELACDECVLAGCSERDRKAYASLLLDTAQARCSVSVSLGGAPLRTRLLRIVSFRSLSVMSVVACVVLTGAVAYFLLTNAV